MTQNSINNEASTLNIDPGVSGDSFVQFDINGIGKFRTGIDDDASDAYKISQGTALGTNDTFVMTTSGERTMPLQPAFLGVLSATDSNVTGNNTIFTVGSGNPFTEIFDQNNDFTVTGTFTAPITGRYFLEFASRLDETPIGSNFTAKINTSNRGYIHRADPSTGEIHLTPDISTIADMDAADTTTFTVQLNGVGADTADLIGGPAGETRVSGALIC